MLNVGRTLIRESRLWVVGMVASALVVSSVAAQEDSSAAKRAQLHLPRFSIGPTVTIDNGIPGDGRLEVVSGRAGETSTVNIDPTGPPPLQDIMFELNHYVDVGADGGAVQLGNTTITREPTVTGPGQVTSAGTFLGSNDGNTISWTAVATIPAGSSKYVTTITFSSTRAFGSTRLIQYADIDVNPLGSNDLVVLGTFNQPNFQLVTVQDPANGNIAFTQAQPQVTNANCVGWAAQPFADLRSAITGAGASYSPAGAVVSLNQTTDSRFPGSPAFGPADITIAIACDLNPNATSATVILTVAAQAETKSATVTSVTGSVQARSQGAFLAVTPGFLVVQGMQLIAGPDGQVQGACSDGSHFTLAANSRVFFDDFLCGPVGSGMLDVTQGTFRLVSAGASGSGGAIRAQNQLGSVRTPVSVGTMSGSAGDFSTTYNEVGSRGTAITQVQSGTVAVTDAVTGAVTTVTAGQQNTINQPVPNLAASILPSSRSVQVGNPATVFATILNAGRSRAIVCEPSVITNVPATFSFQTTDPVTNQVVGTRSTPISIAAGGGQSFVIAFTPTAPIPPTDLQLSFACGQTRTAVIPGVNTMLLSASTTPVPDIVALAATPDNNGIANISPTTGVGAFAVATVNVGVTASITASADTDGVSLPVAISLCQTNPATAVCLAAPASSVTTTINAGATPTFGIFLAGTGAPVPFDPAGNRIFVRFKDAGGVTRGSTSVAVRTQRLVPLHSPLVPPRIGVRRGRLSE
jgi:hypothetical protein